MTLKRNTFEGLSVGTTPTTGNSGGSSGDSFATASFAAGHTGQVTDSPALNGTRSLRLTATAVSGTAVVGLSHTGNRIVAVQARIAVEAKPSAAYNVMTLRHASGNNVVVSHRVDGALDFQGFGGAVASGSVSPVLTDGVEYLVDVVATQDATSPGASNGRIQAQITDVSTGTVIHTYDNAATNTGTAAFVEARFGKTGSSASVTLVLDDVATDDGSTSFITPLSDNPTAVMPTPDRGGTTITYTWSGQVGTVVVTQTAGPTATITRPDATTAVVELPDPQTEDITLRFRATSGETTDDKFATITPGAAEAPLYVVSYKDETGVWDPPLPPGL